MISRAGKATGGNKFWFNVKHCDTDGKMSVNFNDLDAWQPLNEEVLFVKSDEKELAAKFKELENLKEHCVYDEVQDDGQQLVGVRWVLTEKWCDGESITKARLVAKGFEEPSSEVRCDSPTCLKENLRLLLAIAVSQSWSIRTLEIKSAFLQGRKIQREVFLKPPPEANTEGVWRLNKAIYGLNDASRSWYLTAKETLENLGFAMSIFDQSLFYLRFEDELLGLVCLHVDDFFCCGQDKFFNGVIAELKDNFKISKEDECNFNYLGLEMIQNQDGILVNQNGYIDALSLLSTSAGTKKSIIAKEFNELRSAIGQLSWVSKQT